MMNFSLFFLEEESFLPHLSSKNSSHQKTNTTDREKKDKTTEKKESSSDGFVCRSSRRRRRQGYEIYGISFINCVFTRDSFYWRVVSLFLFYFRTHRREDFQDEVRAVPRRRTGGRTQTGTRVCFRRHLFSDTLWSVWEERVERMFEQFRSIVRSDLVVPDALSSRLDLFSTRSILGVARARWNVIEFLS